LLNFSVKNDEINSSHFVFSTLTYIFVC